MEAMAHLVQWLTDYLSTYDYLLYFDGDFP